MMPQLAAVVAQESTDEAGPVSARLAQYLEQQGEVIAQTEETAGSSAAEVLLPGEDVDVTTPLKFNDSVLAGFTLDNRSNAVSNAKKTSRAGATATEAIWQMAGWIQEMKLGLSRKEFSIFVKRLLQWVGDEARKYLDIARTFAGFDLCRLQHLEPFTILKLRSKKYAPIIERLRSDLEITPKLVQDLIKELLPKQTQKKPSEPISGWKQARSGGGRYYNLLLHDEETGMLIEGQAESEGVLPQRIIAEAVALRAQHKSGSIPLSEYRAAQLEELHTVVDNARTLEREKRGLELELDKRGRTIAELEAKLTGHALLPDEMCSEELTGLNVERELEPTQQGLKPEFSEPLHSMGDGLEAQVEQTAEPEATDYLEPEQKSSYLEPASCKATRLSEKQDDAKNLEAENNTVLKEGDLVEINVTRPNGDKTWNGSSAYIQNFVTTTGKVAVLLQGDYRSKHFFLNELKSIEPVEENLEAAVVTDFVTECPPNLELGIEVEPDAANSSNAESEKVALALTDVGTELSAAPSSELLPSAWQKQQSNRKLQPVEILTAPGEWVGGYFVHGCIAVANLVRNERQFTLFDADGEMCRFFGQIRPLRGGATKQENVRQ